MMDETIVLIDEENVEHEFRVEAFLDVENEKYAALIPVCEGEEDSDEVVILRLAKDENGDDILVDIEDDEEWEKVCDEYERFQDEEYDD